MAFAPSSTIIVTYTSSTKVLPAYTGVLQAVRLGDTDTLEVVEAEDLGSTPVLKIALPSSPLPEHRSDRYASRTIGHVHIGLGSGQRVQGSRNS